MQQLPSSPFIKARQTIRMSSQWDKRFAGRTRPVLRALGKPSGRAGYTARRASAFDRAAREFPLGQLFYLVAGALAAGVSAGFTSIHVSIVASSMNDAATTNSA